MASFLLNVPIQFILLPLLFLLHRLLPELPSLIQLCPVNLPFLLQSSTFALTAVQNNNGLHVDHSCCLPALHCSADHLSFHSQRPSGLLHLSSPCVR